MSSPAPANSGGQISGCLDVLTRLFISWFPLVCLLNLVLWKHTCQCWATHGLDLTCNIEYLDNGRLLDSRVWVQFVNSWDTWLRDGLGHLICKIFLMCCFTLPFLWCPYFPVEVVVPLLDTCCHGVGVACWVGSLWKGAENVTRLGQGLGQQLESSSQQVKREEGRELATPWLLVPWREMMTVVRCWNGAVQLPQVCSLCCPAPTLPAAYTVIGISTQPPPRSVHTTSQTKSFLPLLPTKRGQRAGYKSPPWRPAGLQLGSIWSDDICGRRRNLFHSLSSLI